MELLLDPAEAEWLDRTLRGVDEDLQRQIHRSDSHDYRQGLEQQAATLQRIRTRLGHGMSAAASRERLLDERSEESFPGSDSPA